MHEIISRADARLKGLKYYFTGIPCKNGHVCKRAIRQGNCSECNRERALINGRRFRKENPELHRENVRCWIQKNPEKQRRMVRSWHLRNPGRASAYVHNRRAKLESAGGTYTALDIRELFKRQKGKCAYYKICSASIRAKYHIDHIIPISAGGSNFPCNLQLTCPSCNFKKSAKDPIVFSRQIGLLL